MIKRRAGVVASSHFTSTTHVDDESFSTVRLPRKWNSNISDLFIELQSLFKDRFETVNGLARSSATRSKDFVSDVARSFFGNIRGLGGTDIEGDEAKVKITATEPSDVYVVHNTVAPGEASGQLVTFALQIIPAGDGRRIDAPNPGYCPF